MISESHFIASSRESWLTLHLREKRRADTTPATSAGTVLFVHGATLASDLFDIDAPGRSWMADLADAGFTVLALDVRGYGRSSKPASFDAAAELNPPFARAADVVHDIDDAVAFALRRTGDARLNLIGGSWGSVTAGLYTSTIGLAKVDRLVLYAPLFSTRNPGWLAWIEDPERPGQLHLSLGAYRLVSAEASHARWQAELEAAGDMGLLEPATFDVLMAAFLDTDHTADTRKPPSVRVPNGTLADLLEVFTERPLYRPEDITCPTLLIRGGQDPTSTAADAKGLLGRLGSREKSLATVSAGTHFVSAEINAPKVYEHARRFLSGGPSATLPELSISTGSCQ